MLCLLERIPVFRSLGEEIKMVKPKAESCSRQLKGWIQSLQDSEFKGERHVNQRNERTKRIERAAQEREEFLKELAEIRAKAAAGKN